MAARDPDAVPAALPVFDGPPLPEQVSRQAVDWLVALQAPDAGEATHAGWQRWHDAHADHARAWHHIQAFGAQLRDLPAPMVHGALGPGAQAQRARRRGAIRVLALAAVAGSGAWLAREGLWREWQDWQADHRTATGERRSVVLADASRIELDTATAMAVRFDGTQRLVRLLHGRILVATAPDAATGLGQPARPFLVETAEGRLRALGTRFTVRQRAGASELVVLDGAVEVRPADAPQAERIVHAGQQAVFGRAFAAAPLPVHAEADTWTRGMLVARDMPLAEFIAELARYRRGHLACDPAVGQLKVSGIYPLDDTERVLDMLQRTHAVEVQALTRYWATVRPRRGP